VPYELVELTTGNVVGVFDTEDAALNEVAEAIRLRGDEAVSTLALGYDDYPNSSGYSIATGADLARRAVERPGELLPTAMASSARSESANVGGLKEELGAQLRAYLERRTSIQTLYVWIARHAQSLYGSADNDLIDLTNQVWFLLADYGSDSLCEQEVRENLLDLVNTQRLHAV
jgi:hypothetical protein